MRTNKHHKQQQQQTRFFATIVIIMIIHIISITILLPHSRIRTKGRIKRRRRERGIKKELVWMFRDEIRRGGERGERRATLKGKEVRKVGGA